MFDANSELVRVIRDDVPFSLQDFTDYDVVVEFPRDVRPAILAHKPTLVCVAACWGSVECFRYLTHHRSNLMKTDSLGTPLDCFAAVSGNKEVMRHTLTLPIVRPGDGVKNALHYSAEYGHANIVKMLLKRGIYDVNFRDQSGMTALHIAVEHGHKEIVDLLLKDSAVRCEIKDNHGCNILHTIARRKDLIEFANVFLSSRRLDVMDMDGNGWTCLHYAADVGNEDFVERVKDCAFDFEGEGTISPLHLAAKHGFHEILRRLLLMHTCKVSEPDEGNVSCVFTELHSTTLVNQENWKSLN